MFISLIMVEYGSGHKKLKFISSVTAEDYQCRQQTQTLLRITYTFVDVNIVGLTHRPPLPPGNAPGTHFC